VAVIVNVLVLDVPGVVPVIAPVLEFKLNPLGKLPLVKLYAIVLSLVALTVVEYAVLITPNDIGPLAVTHTGMLLYIIPKGYMPELPSVLYTYK
jgi:hypothetical protein